MEAISFNSMKFINFVNYIQTASDLTPLLIYCECIQYSIRMNQQITNFLCNSCRTGVLLLRKNNKTNIKYSYRCNNTFCRKEFSLLFNTKLKGLDIRKFLIICACFTMCKKIADVVREFNINEKVVFKYYSLLRQVCSEYIYSNNTRYGGSGIEVEIDECHLFKRKYNRGRMLTYERFWIFGIKERISKRVYLERVINRSSNTLLGILRRVLRPESIVFCDCWRGYNGLEELFECYAINHSNHFIDPSNPRIHTNNIERTWRSLRESCRGVDAANIDQALKLFMFRQNYLSGTFFEKFSTIIKLFFVCILKI